MITRSFWRAGALLLCLIAQTGLFGASTLHEYETVNYIHTLIFNHTSIQERLMTKQREQQALNKPVIAVDEFIKNELSGTIARDCEKYPNFWSMPTYITNEPEQLNLFCPHEILYLTGFKDLVPIEHRKPLSLSAKIKCFYAKKHPKHLVWLPHNHRLKTMRLCNTRTDINRNIPELIQIINDFLPCTLLKSTPDMQEDYIPYYFNYTELEHSKERLLLFSKNRLDQFLGQELHGRNALIDECLQEERNIEFTEGVRKEMLRYIQREKMRQLGDLTYHYENNRLLEKEQGTRKEINAHSMEQRADLLDTFRKISDALAELSRANIRNHKRQDGSSSYSHLYLLKREAPSIYKPLHSKLKPASKRDFYISPISGVQRGMQEYAQKNRISLPSTHLMISCPT